MKALTLVRIVHDERALIGVKWVYFSQVVVIRSCDSLDPG